MYLVPIRSTKSNPSGILYIVTNQGITTSVLESFLDLRRLISNHIYHQFGSS